MTAANDNAKIEASKIILADNYVDLSDDSFGECPDDVNYFDWIAE